MLAKETRKVLEKVREKSSPGMYIMKLESEFYDFLEKQSE